MMLIGRVMIVLLLIGGVARAGVDDLDGFLRSAEEAGRVPAPLRAEGQFVVTSPGGEVKKDLVMVVRPPNDMFLELRGDGRRALLLPQAGTAYRLTPASGTAETFPADAVFADSDFTREDLEPFQLSRYQLWKIADESPYDITVTLYTKKSQYVLEVVTFDLEKKVPLKVLYYRDTYNNLVKIRRNEDYVAVGQKWRPTSVSMESFKLRTHTKMTLRWTPAGTFPPELFDPAFLARPALLPPAVQSAPAAAR